MSLAANFAGRADVVRQPGQSRRRVNVGIHMGIVTLAITALCGCSAVGPDYQRPVTTSPVEWKTEPGWAAAQPKDAQIKGDWWALFGDATLNALESKALSENNTLAVAQSRLDQARAQTALANSALLPRIGLQGGTSRFKTSAQRPLSNYAVTNTSVIQNDYNAGINVSYELDLSGRVRRQLESAKAGEAQSGADFENTRLVLTAQLAANYFSLRQLDAETAVVHQILAAQKQALDFVNARHDIGSSSALDVAQQQASLSGTEAQLQVLRDQRARFEHAIATLTGVDAPSFSLPAANKLPSAPLISLMQPATLLERRPDIASAERAMAAANAQMGIARSAYYPTVLLAALVGNDSNRFPMFFSLPSMLWSMGMSATQTLFDAGKADAGVMAAKASYEQTAANYRQTVLNAFQEVQDSISTQSSLTEAAKSLNTAVLNAAKVADLTDVRYRGGAANHLELVLAQQTLLGYQRQQVQNQGQQLLSAVQLVKAMGGGWKDERDASAEPVRPPP